MTEDHYRIVVLDDDASFLRALSRQITLMGYSPLAFESANDALAFIRTNQCECLILDLRMPEVSGLDVQKLVAEIPIPVIFISGHASIPDTVQAVQNGAVTFLEKPVEYADLQRAIQTALNQLVELRSRHSAIETAKLRYESLTKRQKDVFALLAEGAPNKTIAYELGIGERTVKAHRRAVMEQIGAKTILDVYRLATELEIIS